MAKIETGQLYQEWIDINNKLRSQLEKQDEIITKQQNMIDRLNEPIDTRLTGSNVEDILSNQKAMINVLNSDKLIFGVYWDKSSNPEMTRLDAAEGLEANVGVDGELVRNDFDKMPIFSEMEDVEDEYGNYFVRIPKFYIQKVNGRNHKITRISKTRYPGFYLPYIFWDFENVKELDYYDHGKYNASLGDDNRLESKPGEHPLVSTNIVNFRSYAENNNDESAGSEGYQQLDVHAQDVLQTLFAVEFATLDSQSIMRGLTSGRYSANDTATVAEEGTNRIIVPNSVGNGYEVGGSIGISSSSHGSNNVTGDARIITEIEPYDSNNTAIYFDGEPVDIEVGYIVANRGWMSGFSSDIAASSGSIVSNTNGRFPCVYRGVENPWGSVYQWVDGININDHQAWIAKDARDYASNVFASPYEQLGYVNNDSNGWVSEMGFDSKFPFAELPVTTGGSSSTYYADNYYQNSGQRVARVGGSWAGGLVAGFWCWSLFSSSSASSVLLGGRLLKKAS